MKSTITLKKVAVINLRGSHKVWVVEVHFLPSLTSTLDGTEWQTSRTGSFTTSLWISFDGNSFCTSKPF